MKTDFPLVQAGFFRPIIDTLDFAGVDTGSLLRCIKLHRFDLSDNENYVPVELMYRLFEELERREGIDDFFDVFAEGISLQSMSDWGDVVIYSPDLLTGINFASEHEDVVLTHQRIGLEIDGPVCKYSQLYLDQPRYLARPRRGREFTDYADFCLAFNYFKQAGGPDWQPLEIHLQSLVSPNFDRLLPTGYRTKIYLGQPATSIVFPTETLTEPMHGNDSVDRSETFETAPQSLSSTVEKLLCSTRDGQLAHLELVAEMLDLSSRTLRRRLVAEGTTFSEIVDGWRFKSSIDLLGSGHSRINEIAERLGYANASNFERAFKRWTGRSAGSYRDSLG